MSEFKCSSLKNGYIFLVAVVCCLAFVFSAVGDYSTSSSNDVTVQLDAGTGDNWTASGASEMFSFTISSSNTTMQISGVNISIPTISGAAMFAVDNTTINSTNSSWTCLNMTSGTVGNITLIECTTGSAYISNGSSIEVNFTAYTSTTTGEDIYQWSVAALNVTDGHTVTQNVSSGIDGAAPSVDLTYPADNSWQTPGNLNFNFTATDASISIENCMLWTNMTGSWDENETDDAVSSGVESNISVYGISDGTYTWNVKCFDSYGNSGFSTNRTLNVGDRSNLVVSAITVPLNPTPYPGQNLIVNVTLLNNGTGDVSTNTTVRMCFGTDSSDPCGSGTKINDTSSVIEYTNLTVGGSYNASFNITITAGGHVDYYIKAYADYGTTENEQNETDNDLIEMFSTQLNVTVNKIWNNNTDATAVNTTLRPGTELKVDITVLYFNGSPVTDLDFVNISVWDNWLYTPQSTNEARYEIADMGGNVSNFSTEDNASGHYIFNYTVPGMMIEKSTTKEVRYAEFGHHVIQFSVIENSTLNNNHTGTSANLASTYNITAPYLEVTFGPWSSIEIDETKEGSFYYYNNGNENITSNLTTYDPEDVVDYWDSGATGEISVDWTNVVIEGLGVGGSYTIEDLDFTGDVVGDDAEIGINVSAIHGDNLYYCLRIFVKDVENDTGSSNDDDDDGTTTTTGGYECTSDDQCDSNEVCDNFECVVLECDEGYVASGHECKLKSIYEISVESFDSEVKVLQGEEVSTNVTVKNTGNKDLTVIMNVELDVEGVEVNVTPASKTIKVDKAEDFMATFAVTEQAAIGKHSGSFKVTTSFSTAKETKDFKLVIQPLPEAIAEIENDYLNYTSIVNQLLSDFESFKTQLSEENLTTMELKVNETVSLFNRLKQSIEGEDYVQAAMYIDQLKGLVNSTRTLMNELGISEGAGSVFWNTLVLWVVVAVVLVGAVGLLIYMMVPPQGYTLGKGYSPQGKSAITDRLKNAVTALRGGMPGNKPRTAVSIANKYKASYSGSYKKLDNAYKPQQTGVAGKVKNVFKKK